MKTKDKFWDSVKMEVAKKCEEKNCRLFYDVLQGMYFLVKKHKDGSVHHDKGTHLYQNGELSNVEYFIDSYTSPEARQEAETCTHPDYAMSKHGSTEICSKCGKTWG